MFGMPCSLIVHIRPRGPPKKQLNSFVHKRILTLTPISSISFLKISFINLKANMKKPDSPCSTKPIILIADDTLTGRRAISSALGKHEYELSLASNGREALALADQLKPED